MYMYYDYCLYAYIRKKYSTCCMNQVSRVEYLGRLELINLAKRIHYNLFIISEHIYS